MKNRIRIESGENVVTNAKILYLPDEGEFFDADGASVSEVDISRCIQGVDLHLHVGEVSRATLHTILVDARVEAGEVEAIVKRLKRSRFWRFRRLLVGITDRLKTRIARSLRPQIQRELAAKARRRA